MGLDMSFYGKRYLWNDKEKAAAIAKLFPEIRGAEVEVVRADFRSWRKANAIHRWFVNNIQEGVDECQESYVPVEKLYELRDICAKVIADPTQAETLLPTQNGFFFGGTEYDEYYWDDVKRTLNWLNDFLLKDAVKALEGWDFYYRASW
jgi:hypothetical protein